MSHSPELLPHLQGPPGGLPQIEVITGPSAPQGPADPPVPWHSAWRLRIFLIAFLAVLLPGAAWDFLRPAQYRAVATVLTAAPTGVGRGLAGESADPQHGAVQDRLLLGQGLLEETLDAPGRSRTQVLWTPMACAPCWPSPPSPTPTWWN